MTAKVLPFPVQGNVIKFYVASRYDRREEMLALAQKLEALGPFQCVSRWVQGHHELEAYVGEHEVTASEAERLGVEFATDDYVDVLQADWVIHRTETREAGYTKGGRHVEFGIALAGNKVQVIIGQRENVFHYMPSVRQFDTEEEFLAAVVQGLGSSPSVKLEELKQLPVLRHGLCPSCLAKVEAAERSQTPRISPYAGVNQNSVQRVQFAGREFTEIDWAIISMLRRSRGPVKPAVLILAVWGPSTDGASRKDALKQRIYRIRQKLEGTGHDIKTHGRKGYAWVPAEARASGTDLALLM